MLTSVRNAASGISQSFPESNARISNVGRLVEKDTRKNAFKNINNGA
jgi:hypothetical protein